MILSLPLDVALIVNDPQVNDPALTLIAQFRDVDGLGILKSPVMESEFVPLKVNALFVVTAAKVSETHCALAIFTVTVIPGFIMTASAEVGTDAPPQVVLLFQLPDDEAVRVAAKLTCIESIKINAVDKAICNSLFFILKFLLKSL